MNIVVYCSAQDGLEGKYRELATALGRWIGANGHTLVYGGVNAGLMHDTAAAIHEAGGRVVGVIPEMFMHRADPLCDELVTTPDLQTRKRRMIEMGDVFVVLPGGIGTLDEWVSTLCVMLVADDDNRRIVAVDIEGMFAHMIRQLEALGQSPFARGKNLTRTIVAHDVNELLTRVARITIGD